MGRRLISDEEAVRRGFGGSACAQRRRVLRETLARFDAAEPRGHLHRLAAANLARWRSKAVQPVAGAELGVFAGDWGEVAGMLTRRYGACFAVLNMANAFVPGGAYVEGAAAQEENLFRRTDCHYRVGADCFDAELDRYHPEMTRLLSARDGRVYLDTDRPRVCLRGPEDPTQPDLGYPWLAEREVFPFFELRAAAQDLRDGRPFDRADALRRIEAQLETLSEHGVRHVVLGAFGCGAFRNPAREVARLYRDAIEARRRQFAVIAFAIFHPGYGPDNHTPFVAAFRD